MMKFFRKIRQKLLSENRISKYLVYAIGEIILVVIGILIALQINNLNEESKDRRKEAAYLERLKEEFVDNRELAKGGIKFHKTQIKNAELILTTIIGDTSDIELEKLHFALLQTGWAWGDIFK